MAQEFDKRLQALAAAGDNLLYGGLKGIEKESLRVAADGSLSMLDHPVGLGSALTNRYITTDFSEALLEFVTPAFETTWEALHCVILYHRISGKRIKVSLVITQTLMNFGQNNTLA